MFDPCILKVLLLALTKLHYNIQKQKGIDLNDSLHLISCSFFIGFPSVGMREIYYRLSQVRSGYSPIQISPLSLAKCIRLPLDLLVHYVKGPFLDQSIVLFSSLKLVIVFT